jgi:predicted nucleic acid-binding protein
MQQPILIDTDVMVDFLRGNATAVALIQKDSKRIVLPSIVVAELYAGVKGQEELAALDRFVGLFRIVPVSTAIARAGGLYSKHYTKSHGLGLADAIVAATVDAVHADLRTLNVKHYPMFKGLKPAYRKTTDGRPSVPGDA